MKIELTPDFCCGGGHCGPLPGYFFVCPDCEQDTNCRTGYELQLGEKLTCFFCKAEFEAKEKFNDYSFEFEQVKVGES